jgi:hypothetical protein
MAGHAHHRWHVMDIGRAHQVLDRIACDLRMLPVDADEIGPGAGRHLDRDRMRDGGEGADQLGPRDGVTAEVFHVLAPSIFFVGVGAAPRLPAGILSP